MQSKHKLHKETMLDLNWNHCHGFPEPPPCLLPHHSPDSAILYVAACAGDAAIFLAWFFFNCLKEKKNGKKSVSTILKVIIQSNETILLDSNS